MSEEIPCYECGMYYGHKGSCSYWIKTGVAEKIMYLEIQRMVDRDIYMADRKIKLLESELAKERECVDFYGDKENTKDCLELVCFQGVCGFGDPIGERARQRIKERENE